MRAVLVSGALMVASSAWLGDAFAQSAAVPAPAAAPVPAPAPASAPTPTPAPTPAPASGPPLPRQNGMSADLLSPTFGNPHPPVTPGGSQRASGIVAGVFGAVFMGTTLGWSALAKSLSDASNKPGECVNDVCTDQGLTDRATARTVGDVATASFIGGSLLLVAGVVLFVTAASPGEQPAAALQLSPGGASLRGTW